MNASPFPMPAAEAERSALVQSYHVWGTPPEREFDRFVDLAAKLFDAPIALLSIVDAHRVWLKARFGLDLEEIDRGDAFCAHTILENDVFVVTDAQADQRFADNPFVKGEPGVRFYAGAPLVAAPGHAIGTVCIVDTKPRPPLTPHERQVLTDLASMAMDSLDRGRLTAAEHDARERFLKIAETSPDAIVCTDLTGRICFWNRGAEKSFGYSALAATDLNVRSFLTDESYRQVADWFRKVEERLPQGSFEGKADIECRRADGVTFPAEISYSSWLDSNGIVICGIVRDITERREAERKLRDLATRDPLTGLPNRSAFIDGLESAIRSARHSRKASAGCALLLIDLDGFKDVNDAFGHGTGDRLLQRLATRLAAFETDKVLVARLSGDEFTIVLADQSSAAEAAKFADKVRAGLKKTVRLRGQQIEIGASVGIATFPEHGTSANELLANADLALYRAKAEGGGHSQIYLPSLRQAASSRRQIESELRRAHRDGEFRLFFQPQVALHDRSILGAEALIRWQHPTRGLLSPMAFLPILETSSVATAVGAWIVETAITNAADWQRLTSEKLRVGVNLFASQFIDPSLGDTVMAALARHGVAPDCLELEITENIALRHDPAVAKPLRKLIDAGVSVAFDDFGTGYGSLSYLKHVPVTRLKIDRSFVQGILSDAGDAAIVRAVVALGRSLGLGVIAEGVESEAQRLIVETLGCHEAQGYLFGKPMPSEDFRAMLVDKARRVA
jgi:diguanylate cyclase (GGDEF)-like protein/PAS domain S-box-containing protein